RVAYASAMIHLLLSTVDHGRFLLSCQHAGGYPPKSVTVRKIRCVGVRKPRRRVRAQARRLAARYFKIVVNLINCKTNLAHDRRSVTADRRGGSIRPSRRPVRTRNFPIRRLRNDSRSERFGTTVGHGIDLVGLAARHSTENPGRRNPSV